MVQDTRLETWIERIYNTLDSEEEVNSYSFHCFEKSKDN